MFDLFCEDNKQMPPCPNAHAPCASSIIRNKYTKKEIKRTNKENGFESSIVCYYVVANYSFKD